MTDRMVAGALMDAGSVAIEHVPVLADQVVEAAPSTGSVEIDDVTGVWEMTPGAMRDVEVDEVFVVLSGAATVDFVDPSLPSIDLGPGCVVRLEAGMRTVWTVRETLRKVYLAG